MWAHLVYGGRLDMEVEGCGLVAVGDHAGGVDLVGMVESMVVDLAGLIGGQVWLVLNLVGIVLNLDGMVLNLVGLVGGLVVVLIGMVADYSCLTGRQQRGLHVREAEMMATISMVNPIRISST